MRFFAAVARSLDRLSVLARFRLPQGGDVDPVRLLDRDRAADAFDAVDCTARNVDRGGQGRRIPNGQNQIRWAQGLAVDRQCPWVADHPGVDADAHRGLAPGAADLYRLRTGRPQLVDDVDHRLRRYAADGVADRESDARAARSDG